MRCSVNFGKKMSGTCDRNYRGTILEGVDMTALKDWDKDCISIPDRSFLVRPLYEQEGSSKLRAGKGVGVKTCCLATLNDFCYIAWLPYLSGCNGFMMREVTEHTP